MPLPRPCFSLLALVSLFLLCSTALAGALGGPKSKRTVVRPYDTDTFTVAFEESELARVRVSGDGSTDLDCAVYDSNGHLIATDLGPSDECLLLWTPAWTGKFKIEVRNLGSKYNEYSIRTN